MLFALVAVSLSTSFGSITLEAHPGARLLDVIEAQVPMTNSAALADLEHQLQVELHRSSPFIAPGILFGAAGLCAILGTIFIFVPMGWAVLLVVPVFYIAAIVFLCVAIGVVIGAAVTQSNRNKHIQELRDEIARLKAIEQMPPPPPPPPGVQNIPTVTPRLVLAHF